ncbi:MAG: hypothetical protein EBR67_08725 [Proteobacteria bacterium]|nr:hypothetical protein [Pseudomonadota bacterium]
MLHNFMLTISKILNTVLNFSFYSPPVYHTGPNNLEELLKQFDQPIKEKTQDDIIRDYTIKETMVKLEVDMLAMEPSQVFKGQQYWTDNEGKSFYDWVPCITRPEVIYCSYGKN